MAESQHWEAAPHGALLLRGVAGPTAVPDNHAPADGLCIYTCVGGNISLYSSSLEVRTELLCWFLCEVVTGFQTTYFRGTSPFIAALASAASRFEVYFCALFNYADKTLGNAFI